MKVLTLNTHSWIEKQPYEKLNSLVESLLEVDYDIIALQEVNQPINAEEIQDDLFIRPLEEQFSVPIKDNNFAYLLVQKLRQRGMTYYWSWTANHIGYDKYDEGVAILSKRSFEVKGHLISKAKNYTSYLTRKVLKAQIEQDNIKWTVISGHYSWWLSDTGEHLFKYEWDKTLALLDFDEKENLIVMGDFNNDPKVANEGYTLIEETAPFLVDTFKVANTKIGEMTVQSAIDGWQDQPDQKRIDYIFTGKNISVDRYRVVFDGYQEPVVSDHFGVEALIVKDLRST
ncbi:endonuclease/exonuclease/phosphatase family protein [Marinilactibacillus sp. Marseille-P9653]|uniref:endonuclease/exonuclease/phosphatase family protein n=1 Tax=Marinilactibacillus sp. Marseille-P9653 TaxID=2866583 RepID=UPI001CE3B7EA|nr:endonuclease/exonuclease/phosphatase family protein [Marinilactibacillus sp. Marseille-P9653]